MSEEIPAENTQPETETLTTGGCWNYRIPGDPSSGPADIKLPPDDMPVPMTALAELDAEIKAELEAEDEEKAAQAKRDEEGLQS